MTPRTDVVKGRDCSNCTMCCELLGVEELEMPPSGQCPNCRLGTGCMAYEQRPTECSAFYCEYLLDPRLGDHWRPSKCRTVVVFEDYSNALVIHADPKGPQTWRTQPYISEIRAWARLHARRQQQVIVWHGETKYIIAADELDTEASEAAVGV
jgi:hypothetical protein